MSIESDRFVRIDPRDFINPPFVECPECGADEFGILSIHDHGFSRRCRNCRFTDRESLPPIRKAVIYLDQFAISNLMIADSNYAKVSSKEKHVSQFWHDLLDKMKELLDLQLVVCPQSAAHDSESSLSRYNKSLKRLSESLSLGVSFYDFETIRRLQIAECLRNWLKGRASGPLTLDIQKVVSQNPHVWTDRFLISVSLGDVPGYADALRAERDAGQDSLSKIFMRWKDAPLVSWEEWYQAEAADYGPTVLKAYQRDLIRFRELRQGIRPVMESDVFPTTNQILVTTLLSQIRDAGIANEDASKKVAEFLNSSDLKLVPFNQIAASLYASVAKKAAHQKKLPTKGFFTDVAVVSCLLPYCDAMFLDVECWNYISELNRSNRLPYSTRVFSLRNKDAFSTYLDELRASASPEHLETARAIYGA